MHVRVREVAILTDGDGAATAYCTAEAGMLDRIQYVKTDFADGVDFAITLEDTGESLWTQEDVNAAAVVAPRQATHDLAGVATLYAAGGATVRDRIAVKGRIKVVIASGGAAKTGLFRFWFV